MKFTPWFGCSTKPVRPGIYQRRHKTLWFKVYSMWDGEKWMLGATSIVGAELMTEVSASQSGYFWRGIIKC